MPRIIIAVTSDPPLLYLFYTMEVSSYILLIFGVITLCGGIIDHEFGIIFNLLVNLN
jgi:hypothetical protein